MEYQTDFSGNEEGSPIFAEDQSFGEPQWVAGCAITEFCHSANGQQPIAKAGGEKLNRAPA
jgi:hypothetical protein